MRPAPQRGSRRVCVAQIGAPHGVRGEVRLKSFTEDPFAVAQYGALAIEDGARSVEILSLRPAKEVLIARLAGITDRTQAEALTNLRLFVDRDRLPPIAERDTYYQADLIGLHAKDSAGGELGTVVAVQNFGAHDILEIAPAAGGSAVMVPFSVADVPEVDLVAGVLTIAEPTTWFAPQTAAPADEASSEKRLRGT